MTAAEADKAMEDFLRQVFKKQSDVVYNDCHGYQLDAISESKFIEVVKTLLLNGG